MSLLRIRKKGRDKEHSARAEVSIRRWVRENREVRKEMEPPRGRKRGECGAPPARPEWPHAPLTVSP
jgi:hypothetical protein